MYVQHVARESSTTWGFHPIFRYPLGFSGYLLIIDQLVAVAASGWRKVSRERDTRESDIWYCRQTLLWLHLGNNRGRL